MAIDGLAGNPVRRVGHTHNTKEIVKCLGKGLLVGAAGALVIGGLAIAAAAIAPAAVVTGALLLAGGIGGGLALYAGYTQASDGNWAGVAYTAGSVIGGFIGGSVLGGRLATTINPTSTRGFWSIRRDVANRYRPNYPGGSTSKWLETGPDAAAATGAIGTAGTGAAIPANGGC